MAAKVALLSYLLIFMSKLKKNIFILSALSAVLLSIPFLMPHCGWVALFGFVPLFAAQTLAENHKVRFFFLYYYFSFVLWNAVTTFWIWFATPAGAIAAILLNSLQMAVIFWLFITMKKVTKGYLPYLFFIVTWLAWEHGYANCDISWPWLTLGNSFATSIRSIQWYEVTGTLGGSLWILLCNTLLYRIITLKLSKQRIRVSLLAYCLVLAVPFAASHILWSVRGKELLGSKSKEILVIQPNIDPYNEKFGGLTQQEQNDIFFKLYSENFSKEVSLVLAPETFVSPSSSSTLMIENKPFANESFCRFKEELANMNCKYGSTASMIFGAVTDYIYYGHGAVAPSETAREIPGLEWYDRYNTAVFLSSNGEHDFYHKSKLVILVESTPFKGLMKFLKRFEIDLGGMLGSFGKSPDAEVFILPDSVKVGTAICYESVYGDYYRRYVEKGAGFMTIITNDGWWRDTPGYRQHLSFASLRAIETRRDIARCANTGISAFINSRGEIISQTAWNEAAALKGSVSLNDRKTIFVVWGDLIGRIGCFVFFLLFLMLISRLLSRKRIVYEN